MAVQHASHYQVLEVRRDALQDAIKQSYRRLALKWHPDKNGGSTEGAENFKMVQEAYRVLSDPEARHRYDQELGPSNRPLSMFIVQNGGSQKERKNRKRAMKEMREQTDKRSAKQLIQEDEEEHHPFAVEEELHGTLPSTLPENVIPEVARLHCEEGADTAESEGVTLASRAEQAEATEIKEQAATEVQHLKREVQMDGTSSKLLHEGNLEALGPEPSAAQASAVQAAPLGATQAFPVPATTTARLSGGESTLWQWVRAYCCCAR
eukprot:Skav215668  [mRNA]  locus=scaffold310:106491:107285:+ [translate_table: standard]